jgi:NADH-quinone oxidoreductase subunit L
MDTLYNTLVVQPFKAITELNKNDAVDSVYTAIVMLSRRGHLMASAFQTGHIRWYASSMALGTVVIIAIGWLS